MSMQQVKRKMERLKLDNTVEMLPDLTEEAAKEKSSPLEFFDRILSLEVEAKEERRIASSLKVSGLPKGMRLDNFDFLFQPSVEKQRIDIFSDCEFISRGENILFFGPPGVGKTHLAVGLGVRAIEIGHSVIYYTLEELLAQLKKRTDIPVSKQKGRAYVKNALVIVDEIGYQALDRFETHLFFQFISVRYAKGSTILTSNCSVLDWGQIFAQDELAVTAILDRLLHKAHLFNIDGKSYRMKDFDQMLAKKRDNHV